MEQRLSFIFISFAHLNFLRMWNQGYLSSLYFCSSVFSNFPTMSMYCFYNENANFKRHVGVERMIYFRQSLVLFCCQEEIQVKFKGTTLHLITFVKKICSHMLFWHILYTIKLSNPKRIAGWLLAYVYSCECNYFVAVVVPVFNFYI